MGRNLVYDPENKAFAPRTEISEYSPSSSSGAGIRECDGELYLRLAQGLSLD